LHQEPAQQFEQLIESHNSYGRFAESSKIDPEQRCRLFQKGGLQLKIRYYRFDFLSLTLERPARSDKHRRPFGRICQLPVLRLENHRTVRSRPVAETKMVEAARHIELPDSRKFTHQYPQSPELHGVARLPYSVRHGIRTDDASVLGGIRLS
jgi:hypothetical protein